MNSPITGSSTGSAALDGWLRLTLSQGVGGETQRKLLAAFGLPEAIFAAGRPAVEAIIGGKAHQLFDADNEADIEKALRWSEQPGCHVLTLGDADYPQALLQIPDPPTVLYVRGRLDLLNRPGLAIVGSRNATPQGCQTAESFARSLSDGGLTIISGLALGIDAAAHRGAVDSVAGTVAIIGTGADRIYPARNRDLALAIAERGAIISEFPLGTPAAAANFPRRNRLISGLARGVLVVEAAPQSGSLITARQAGEQGREVFAIPGSIHSPLARGCHQLIKQGAKLVETAHDILEELGWQTALGTPVAAVATDPVLAAIGHEICDLDTIAARTTLPTDQLLALLLELELSGRVASLPGNRYQCLFPEAG